MRRSPLPTNVAMIIPKTRTFITDPLFFTAHVLRNWLKRHQPSVKYTQLVQLRLFFQKRKLSTMSNFGSDMQGITFVVSKFAVVSLVCVLDAISKKQFRVLRGK